MSDNMTIFADDFENAEVYVGTYKKYTLGNISGEWVRLFDFDDKESFIEHCEQIHSDEPADEVELMFQDYDGLLECMYSENHIDEGLWVLKEWLENERYYDAQAVFDMIDDIGYFDVDEIIETFDNSYIGEYISLADFAQQSVDGSDIPEWIEPYIDWDRYANDLEHEGYWISDNGHVFSPY